MRAGAQLLRPGTRTSLITALTLALMGVSLIVGGVVGGRALRGLDRIVRNAQVAAADVPTPELEIGNPPGGAALKAAVDLLTTEHELLVSLCGALVTIGAILLILSALQLRLWRRTRIPHSAPPAA